MLSAYFVTQKARDACPCPHTAFPDSIVRLITFQIMTVTVVSDQAPSSSEDFSIEGFLNWPMNMKAMFLCGRKTEELEIEV